MRPEDIKNRTFANQMRGYDKDEVRSFLFRVAESSRELHEQLAATEAQLASAAAAPTADVEWHDIADEPVESEAIDGDADGLADVDGSADFGSDAPVDPISTEADPIGFEPVVADEFVDTPTLAAAEQSIADRYGALGDRIADLLRNADESAAQILAAAEHDSAAVRAQAEAEAAQVRLDAEEHASHLLAEAQSIRAEADAYREQILAELESSRVAQETAIEEARRAAENDVETYRVDSINEIQQLRDNANAEMEELRNSVHAEVTELKSAAESDAEQLRASTMQEAMTAVEADQNAAAQLREEADADRAAARAELADVRNEVSTLLEQARTQSEFIKQEADEIIRTKVRASFEQAQSRIDVLRNTEVASRERIVLAQSELASALSRLDAEPMPALDTSDIPAVLEEAERRHDEIAGVTEQPELDNDVVEGEGFEGEAFEAGVIEADVIEGEAFESEAFEAGVIEADVVEGEGFESEAFEAGVIDADAVEAETFEPAEAASVDAFDDGTDVAADEIAGGEADEVQPDALDDGMFYDEPSSHGEAATESFDAASLESDSSIEAMADASEDSNQLAAFFEPDPATEGETTGDILSSAFGEAPATDTVDSFPGDSFGTDSFEAEEYVETTEYGLPIRGVASDEEAIDEAPAAQFGAASLSEALPTESVEVGGPEEEDALARLVREAMQEAVDSARKKD